jgi:hypothetical protein
MCPDLALREMIIGILPTISITAKRIIPAVKISLIFTITYFL